MLAKGSVVGRSFALKLLETRGMSGAAKHAPMPPATLVKGKLSVVDSATVICLRHRGEASGRKPELLARSRFGEKACDGSGGPRSVAGSLDKVFAGLQELDFTAGWEVLLGQNECVNWVRSAGRTVGSGLRFMRYPGEFKLAGGAVDEGETYKEAARRELEEEFLSPADLFLPADVMLRPFTVKQTLPINSKSNIMWNFVALAEENEWLASLDVEKVNRALAMKRAVFEEMLNSGEYWSWPREERELVSPEVRQLRWMPLCEAVWLMLSTLPEDGAAHFVNDFQQEEFARLGIKRRDPMFITAAALLEAEAFPGPASLVKHCQGLENTGGMAAEQQRIQWLFPGMTQEDVTHAHRTRGEPNEMIKNWPTIQRLRAERSQRPVMAKL